MAGACDERNMVHEQHDSMVTVRLSETPITSPVTETAAAVEEEEHLKEVPRTIAPIVEENDEDTKMEEPVVTANRSSVDGDELPVNTVDTTLEDLDSERRKSDSSEASDGESVNWEVLKKEEEQEPRDEGSDDVGVQHCTVRSTH